MHFEVLIEDRSGKIALDLLLPRILADGNTYNVHPYRGIGRLPSGLRSDPDPKKKMLLTQLPRLLQGYGRTFAGYPPNYQACVVCICDLDSRCRHDFRLELLNLLDRLDPAPQTYFCIAEEEIEAWLLGDRSALKAAYPNAKEQVLDAYIPDSICGTWEVLANAIYQGGSEDLRAKAYYEIGAAKCEWAENIAFRMNVDSNTSPSFCYLRTKLRFVS